MEFTNSYQFDDSIENIIITYFTKNPTFKNLFFTSSIKNTLISIISKQMTEGKTKEEIKHSVKKIIRYYFNPLIEIVKEGKIYNVLTNEIFTLSKDEILFLSKDSLVYNMIVDETFIKLVIYEKNRIVAEKLRNTNPEYIKAINNFKEKEILLNKNKIVKEEAFVALTKKFTKEELRTRLIPLENKNKLHYKFKNEYNEAKNIFEKIDKTFIIPERIISLDKGNSKIGDQFEHTCQDILSKNNISYQKSVYAFDGEKQINYETNCKSEYDIICLEENNLKIIECKNSPGQIIEDVSKINNSIKKLLNVKDLRFKTQTQIKEQKKLKK